MESVASFTAVGLACLCFLSFYRAIAGPHTEDRLIAVNVVTTKAILVMITWATTTRSYEFIDVALVCSLLSFVATIAVLKGTYRGHLG